MDRNPENEPLQKGRIRTILIVEDEELMLRLLERYFSRHGYRVLAASDGEQAIEMYRADKHQIDAVLLDVRLPRLTGEEVYQQMKDENAVVKVVLASGFLEPELRTEMAVAGVKHFVNKPYNLDELLKTFQSVIDNE